MVQLEMIHMIHHDDWFGWVSLAEQTVTKLQSGAVENLETILAQLAEIALTNLDSSHISSLDPGPQVLQHQGLEC